MHAFSRHTESAKIVMPLIQSRQEIQFSRGWINPGYAVVRIRIHNTQLRHGEQTKPPPRLLEKKEDSLLGWTLNAGLPELIGVAGRHGGGLGGGRRGGQERLVVHSAGRHWKQGRRPCDRARFCLPSLLVFLRLLIHILEQSPSCPSFPCFTVQVPPYFYLYKKKKKNCHSAYFNIYYC